MSPNLGTHCLEPFTPPHASVVVKDYQQLIDFGTYFPYICDHGMRFEDEFSKAETTALCKETNIWDPPAEGWFPCVESECFLAFNDNDHVTFGKMLLL